MDRRGGHAAASPRWGRRVALGVCWLLVLAVLGWLATSGGPYQPGWWDSAPECVRVGTCSPDQLRAATTRLWLGVLLGAVALVVAWVQHLPQRPRRATVELDAATGSMMSLLVVAHAAVMVLAFVGVGLFFGFQTVVLAQLALAVLGALLFSSRRFAAPRRRLQFVLLTFMLAPGLVAAMALQSVARWIGAGQGTAFALGTVLGLELAVWGAFLLAGGRVRLSAD